MPRFNGWLMGRPAPSPEKGQAIVIIALVIVLMIAIAGLAIDGGGLLLLRRDTQNAVDAAVMAAAYARCTGADSQGIQQAALDAARQSGFQPDARTTITVHNPPTSGPKAPDPEGATLAARSGDFDYVEVIITREKPKYFIQVVYSGDLKVTSRGVGYCTPGSNVFAERAIVAMSDHCQDSLSLTGANIYVEGGLYANHQLKIQPGGGQNGGTIIGPVAYYDSFNGQDRIGITPGSNNPTRLSASDRIINFPLLYEYAAFRPGGAVAQGIPAADYHYSPTDLDLSGVLSGLYVTDGSVRLNNAQIDPQKGVTIVAQGNIHVVNNVRDQVFASYLTNGLLFLSMSNAGQQCGNNQGIDLNGAENSFNGFIYAPLSAIRLSGSASTVNGALIARNIGISGADLRVIYNPRVIPAQPPDIRIAD